MRESAAEYTPLDIDHATKALCSCAVGHTLLYRTAIDSTMTLARSVATDAKISSGAVVVAEEQSAGKGRLARSWEAPAGVGLLCTIALKGPQLPVTPGIAPMLAGLAVIDALTELAPSLGPQLALKWPNDVLITGGRRAANSTAEIEKVAGILAESVLTDGVMSSLLLGIGINVNQRRGQLPPRTGMSVAPTSMALATRQTVDRTALLIALCRALAWRLDVGRTAPATLFADWRTRLHTLGRAVTASRSDGTVITHGRAVDVQPDGSLIVEESDGRRVTVASGDVTLRRTG